MRMEDQEPLKNAPMVASLTRMVLVLEKRRFGRKDEELRYNCVQYGETAETSNVISMRQEEMLK